jgi:hypothetical protein
VRYLVVIALFIALALTGCATIDPVKVTEMPDVVREAPKGDYDIIMAPPMLIRLNRATGASWILHGGMFEWMPIEENDRTLQRLK